MALATDPQRREHIEREIDATDRQIDALVYQLYGLTDEEIAIVEASTGSAQEGDDTMNDLETIVEATRA